jgi:hypothetical protein
MWKNSHRLLPPVFCVRGGSELFTLCQIFEGTINYVIYFHSFVLLPVLLVARGEVFALSMRIEWEAAAASGYRYVVSVCKHKHDSNREHEQHGMESSGKVRHALSGE